MDYFEFDLQRLILSDLAKSVSNSLANEPTVTPELQNAIDAIESRVETRVVPTPDEAVENSQDVPTPPQPRVFMPASRTQCNIAFGELAPSMPEPHSEKSVSVLTDILCDVPFIDFEHNLSWNDWALPDRLVYSVVTGLLRLVISYPQYRTRVVDSIVSFASNAVSRLETESPAEVITQVAPSFHGFYRAIISTPFAWTLGEWQRLFDRISPLFSSDLVDRLNNLLPDYLASLQEEDSSAHQDLERVPAPSFVHTLLSRYLNGGRPLSGYLAVCSVIEIQWTVLAQSLLPLGHDILVSAEHDEAAAANHVWAAYLDKPAPKMEKLDSSSEAALRATIASSMQCFTDLLVQIEELDGEPPMDTYAWETMSESLKLATICSVALQDLDAGLYSRLRLLLSDGSPIYENLVQEAALKSTTVLAHNFPSIAFTMAHQLRKFLTAPLPIFESEFVSENRAPPPLVAAAKCLALCIDLAPGDDLAMSYMYSLLNYIASSKELGVNQHSNAVGNSPYMHTDDQNTLTSTDTGLRGYSEEERRLIRINTISVVTRLVLEFEQEEVTRLTISMLLQHLRSAEPTAEAAISANLVDLALAAPKKSFVDITRAFSAANQASNPDDPDYTNNMVLAAQTRLAQELHKRPDLYETYLTELLVLFADKGVAVQTRAASSPNHAPPSDLIAELSGLVLPIDALISHTDFNPHVRTSPELAALFRNMWFLCVLFGLASDDKASSMSEWQTAALARIATKTPPFVVEAAQDYPASDIEYNPVIRKDYAQTAIVRHRATLTQHISIRARDVQSLSPAQVIFVLTLHDLETLRTRMGLPSSIVHYFVNEGLNKSGALAICMDSIAEKVMRGCVTSTSRKIVDHALDSSTSKELVILLVNSCHRVAKVREVASKYLNRLVVAFPSLMCDGPLVYAILEVLTLLRKACEGEFTDEYNPVHEHRSDIAGISLQLTDSYAIRNEMLMQLERNANTWFNLAIARAPMEVQAVLQKYLADQQTVTSPETIELGASLALQYATAFGPSERKLAPISGDSSRKPDRSRLFVTQFQAKAQFLGEAGGVRLANRGGLDDVQKLPPMHAPLLEIHALKTKMTDALVEIRNKTSALTVHDLRRLLFRCASVLISEPKADHDLLHYVVAVPFEALTPASIATGIEAWSWLFRAKPDLETALMLEIYSAWMLTIKLNRGLFSRSFNSGDPFSHPIEYSPTDKAALDRALLATRRLLTPHTLLIQMLISRFQAVRYRDAILMILLLRLVMRSAMAHKALSTHPSAREARFSLLLFGFESLRSSRMDTFSELRLREVLYQAAFSWFAVRPQWSYGANRVQTDSDIKLLNEFLEAIQNDTPRADHTISSFAERRASQSIAERLSLHKSRNQLLRLLVDNEITRLRVWSNPTHDPKRGQDHVGIEKTLTDEHWIQYARVAWKIDPAVAVYMVERFKHIPVQQEVTRLLQANPRSAVHVPEAVPYFLGPRLDLRAGRDLKYLVLWAPVPPVVAVTFFQGEHSKNPVVCQYAHRVLEQHPVEVTFFFVPQIVQALRTDALGYIERFIFETAKISQLFCHQIIWNMKANCYKDDAGVEEDPMKPMFDRMIAMVIASLSGEAREFYDREFGFFNEVTDISGKLKPYIKKTKPEKKAKIDEEMDKIKVEVGVYLPSNPDGKVVDIDKRSGRPLQSHAKAPFMATFKVRKERIEMVADPDSVLDGPDGNKEIKVEYDVWQQAIFKVGDDCRQDVLALQIIAMFKNIFTSAGLTLYLFPYRVTATGPGCGVIDVVPNATSRDEMGRAKVNDLLSFFISKYGNPDTLAFQKARLNFIQSMAAYSVACYILQIKDRHNGNIMIDGEGHIVHVGPGGVKFEPNSFKLNHEMIVLMGGRYSQGYSLFVNLTVKAFLAIRPHADQLVETVHLMLGTGLPSFKGEPTIRRLKDRFVVGMTERQAGEWMMGVIKNAHENYRSTVYDEFQRVQNGIPYA